ncbi:hypothetical protein [Hydrogenophaga sp. 5NK40-0174]|uniref:hypothetical protein n=1 Tax=Hydrogenophaga sp. 5NK40-0174 TaxID=3127649 RepID=UPI003107671E
MNTATRRPTTAQQGRARWAILLLLALTLGAAWATNPDPDQHRQAIRQAIGERSPLSGLLGLGALTAFVSDYHPLGLGSYTTVNGKTVSIGAFGQVFVLDTDKSTFVNR